MRSTCRCTSSTATAATSTPRGESFRDFLRRQAAGAAGRAADASDWADHLTTIFPEVRLKQYLEMRGADGGPWRRICALPALWVGLLYDEAALDAAWELVKGWTADHQQLRREVPRLGLKTPFKGGSVRELARRVLAIALEGLSARARARGFGKDETCFLYPSLAIAESGLYAGGRAASSLRRPLAGER